MTPRQRISERVNRSGDVNDIATPRPLLTLEEFFSGNDVVRSIGCNLIPVPSPAQFLEQSKRIATRPDVADVRVQVTMFDSPEWPFSDSVWVITSAEPQQVSGWFEAPLSPDGCYVGWPTDTALERCEVPAGMQPVLCWWD
jgi:hypothetical protein